MYFKFKMELDERAHELLKRFDQIQGQSQREVVHHRERIMSQCEKLAQEIDSGKMKSEHSLKYLNEFVNSFP